MKHGIGGLAGASVVAVLVAGCGGLTNAGDSDIDRSTSLAMEACQIREVEDREPDGERYEMPDRGDGSWDFNDPVDDLEELADKWRGWATAAEAAYQIDDQWNELSGASTFNFTFVSRVVSLRKSGRVLTDRYLAANWPESYEEGRRYNENLDKIEVICGGLLRNLEEQ